MTIEGSRILEWAVLTGLLGALVYIAAEDMKRYRIRNEAVMAVTLLFGAWCLARADLSLFLTHAAFAGALGLLLVLAFALGLMGGGDVKLLAAAFLWLGAGGATLFSILLSVLAGLYVIGAKLEWLPSREKAGRRQIPYGPAICAALGIALARSIVP